MKLLDKYKEKYKQHMAKKKEEDKIIAKVREEERVRQRIQTAKYVEKARGERQRKFHKQGGVYGQFMKIAASTPKPNKGKKYKKQKPMDMMDFKIDI